MSRHARQRRRRRSRGGPSRILLTGLAVLAGVLLPRGRGRRRLRALCGQSTPGLASRHPVIDGASSQVFAADGTRLGFIQSDELRSPIPWSQIPANLANATVAIEDQRFYKDDGVDLTGIFRAAVKDISCTAKRVQGGSTITMQLMRNLYLGGDEHTLEQKIVEAKLALEYKEHHSKRSILTSYLNSVPYGTVGGQTAIGVQAASRIFFDRPASQLDLEQAALLAGLPQAPSEYNPFLYPAAARQRRNEVLAKMAELHYVTPAQAAAAAARATGAPARRLLLRTQRRLLLRIRPPAADPTGTGAELWNAVGCRVYTTLDLHMQELAHKAIAEVLDEPEDPASAIVTIDPHNGYIETMAESESYEQSQFNLASEGHRQPGSTFKAIDLADALSKGVDPNTTYYDSHTLLQGWLAAEPKYEVTTFGGDAERSRSTSSVRRSNLTTPSTRSSPPTSARKAITQMAYKMGVKTHLIGNPGRRLGAWNTG